jgi:hypothetical protein
MKIVAADNLGGVLGPPLDLPANGYVKITLTDGRVLSIRENDGGNGLLITSSPGGSIKTTADRKTVLYLDLE